MIDRTEIHNDEKEHVITIKDDGIYGYTDIIEKVMHRKQPHIMFILRRKPFDKGVYRIRNGQTKRMTHDEIEILDVQQVMWLKLTNDEAKQILGTDLPPLFGNYLRDLRKFLSKHDLSFTNIPFLYRHLIRPIEKPMQQKLL